MPHQLRFTWILAVTGLFGQGIALADPTSYKDWELRCDNTRTCRAAGYQAESAPAPVSLRITRAAGPGTAVEMTLQVSGDKIQGPLRFKVGKAVVPGLSGDVVEFKPAQVRSILPELLKASEAQVSSADGAQWQLSLAGLNAALLKMDELQGRLGTPGALVRRGNKPEASVLPPVPMPVVKVAAPVPARPADEGLAARIFPLLNLADAKDGCNNADELNAAALSVHRLDAQRVLLGWTCLTGAYNETGRLWIANDKPPYAPVALEAEGEFDPESMSINLGWKGRGLGDCWSSRTWHFDGQKFVLTGVLGDGMCRGFPGGAWSLPGYVTEVIAAKSAASKKP